ncbi:MAG: low molecular weight protein-tyrosine-phosphatase [Pseudomarimonas sp.]
MNSILFVCMGNICRSPLAEGIMRAAFAAAGLRIEVDSAGTLGYHAGEAADPRARAVAKQRGIPIDDLRARQLCIEDFHRFDLILAADSQNLAELKRLQPSDARAQVALLLDWAGAASTGQVPDPYYGDRRDFERVFDLLSNASHGLVARLRSPDTSTTRSDPREQA